MKRAHDKERFIELRAEGRSYADIAAELGASKTTVIGWGKELHREVTNAQTLRLDALINTYAVAKAKRVEVFGKKLDAIMDELDNRDLSDLSTHQLLKLALDYGDRLKAEDTPLTMQGDQPEDVLSGLITLETWAV